MREVIENRSIRGNNKTTREQKAHKTNTGRKEYLNGCISPGGNYEHYCERGTFNIFNSNP
jgi:hypothetical protein